MLRNYCNNTLRLLLLTTALANVNTAAAEGCQCLWQGGFAKVQSSADLVISALVINSKGNAIDVAPLRIMRGKLWQDTVRIWLKTGDYCRPPVDDFPIDSTWVMALHKIKDDVPGGFNPNTPNLSYGRIGDYALSSCGGYWLKQEQNWVTGNLIQAPRWDRNPNMSPVSLELVQAFIDGKASANALEKAAKPDPALRDLKNDTKSFLRETQ